MTLVIALKWIMKEGEAILVGSDSRVTYGPIAYEAKKIYPIYLLHNEKEIDLAVAGGARDPSLAKYSYALAESVLKEECELKGFRCLTQEEFGVAAQQIESKLISKFNSLRKEGIEPSFQMILASVDPSGKASMYAFDNRGLAEPLHDDPGFALIGSGAATGGMLLTRLLGYSIGESANLDLGVLMAFVIDLVSEVDPAVGPFIGESFLMRIGEKEVTMGPLTTEAFREYKTSVEQRRNLKRLLQKVCDQDKGREKQIERYLERLFNRGIRSEENPTR